MVNEKEEKNSESQSTELIKEAKKAAELMKVENDRKEKLIEREEALQVERTLGGSADAGAQKKSKEEIITEQAKKTLEGTGFEDMI